MKALVVGCGSIGKRHLRNLKQVGVNELLAFDPRPDRVQEAIGQTGAQGCTSLAEGLGRKPDLVVVATPNSLHIGPALEAARAGCHLFIEKPLSHTLDRVDELEREVSSRGLVALVGCNMRFHPGIQIVKKLVEENVVGRVLSARIMAGSYLPEWHPWEDYRQGYSARADLGGGAVLDGIHEIDYLLGLLGEPSEVACFCGTIGGLGIETEDCAEIVVRMRAGAIANIHLDYIQRTYIRTCHIAGNEGTIAWDFIRPEVQLYKAAEKKWTSLPYPAQDANDMYVSEIRHLLACLEGRQKPAQDLSSARLALEVACAAKEASATGHTQCVATQRNPA